MKAIQFIFLIAISGSLFAQDIPEKEIKTSIEEVMVFFEGAQVSRSIDITAGPGKSILKFTDLSPFIDAKSIQAKVSGKVTVLSINHQQNFLEALDKPEELIRLESRLKEMDRKIRLEQTHLSIITEELDFLRSNKVVGGKNESTSITSLKEASEFYGNKLTALKLKEIERRQTLTDLQEERTKISNQISTITSRKEFASGEILIEIKAENATKINIDLSYLVGNAGWYPSYDVKAISVEDPIEIIYKANVHQDTKVDWKNVKLSFSSGNPDISSVAPELKPYFLNYGSYPPTYKGNINQVEGVVFGSDGESLPGVMIQIEGTMIGTSTDANGRYSLTIPTGGGSLKYSYIGYKEVILPIRSGTMNVTLEEDHVSLDEVVVMAYGVENESDFDRSLKGSTPGLRIRGASTLSKSERAEEMAEPIPVIQIENQTTVEFEIEMPYTLKSDTKTSSVDMAQYETEAYYEYYCVPKIDKDAFLIANITDWERLKLIEGEANLFFEETYIGKTILDTRFVSDTLSISLGRDKNVSVAREKIKDIKTKKIIGTRQEDTRAWEIGVKNNKSQAINMVILDQVPVSMNTDIELNIEDKSGAGYNDKNGEIRWSFTLEPLEKKNLKLKYSVKYPRNRHLIIE